MEGLFEPARYARAIDRIARRRIGQPSELTLQAHGVGLLTLWRERSAAARRIAEDLRAARLPAAAGRVVEVQRANRMRRLYQFPLLELIVHDAVAEWLNERAETAASARLYSYRRGRSSHGAVRDFAAWVRQHRRRGSAGPPAELFVVRRDVSAYFDSIPVGDDAPLWRQLSVLVNEGPGGPAYALLQRVVRPLLVDAGGRTVRLDVGVPTGSPIANVVANVNLGDLDAEATGFAGAYYARYGDDILAAHPDAALAAALRTRLARGVTSIGLRFSPAKARDLCLTASGRSLPFDGGSFAAAPAVDFLGYRIGADGVIALTTAKTRDLLAALRAAATRAAVAIEPPAARAREIVAALNRRLDPGDALAHPYAEWLRHTVTDRGYLGRLDHELALITVEALLGHRGPRAFRDWPPRRLRNEFGLRSLVATRNEG